MDITLEALAQVQPVVVVALGCEIHYSLHTKGRKRFDVFFSRQLRPQV